jgi:hypothetical protein
MSSLALFEPAFDGSGLSRVKLLLILLLRQVDFNAYVTLVRVIADFSAKAKPI